MQDYKITFRFPEELNISDDDIISFPADEIPFSADKINFDKVDLSIEFRENEIGVSEALMDWVRLANKWFTHSIFYSIF